MPSPETPVNGKALIHCERLTKLYPEGQVKALDGVSFDVFLGEYVAIMGPSGSGKSTLLNLLGGLDLPSSGLLALAGEPISREDQLERWRIERVGFIFQGYCLLPTLTACENVQIPMFERSFSPSQRKQRADELLGQVGLSHRASHLPSQLSGGERQRVAIARALANSPSLLLADEPTGNLDSHTGEEILALFDRLRGIQPITLMLVTHSPEVAQRAERLIRLRDGHIERDEKVQK